MKVVTVTVNYRTPQLTIGAVESLLPDLTELKGRAIVVDNDSRDGSYETISREVVSRGWSDTVEVVKADRNGGFGYGNNLAMRTALGEIGQPEYFFCLGPDATVDPGGLSRLVEFMDRNPRVGLAGSKTRRPDGSARISAFRFPSILSELEWGLQLGLVSRALERWTVRMEMPDGTTAVDWVSAASLIVRRKMLEDVGMFDEDFFLYFEETDLCKRARLGGWATWFVAESTGSHIGQASTGVNDRGRRKPAYWFDSRRRYFLKHHGIGYLWSSNVVFAVCYASWWLRCMLSRKEWREPPGFLADFVRRSFWPVDTPRWRAGHSQSCE